MARDPRPLFFAACSEEPGTLPFDRVLFTAPSAVLVQRLVIRTGNAYDRDDRRRAQVLAHLVEVKPLLRRSADLVLTATDPSPVVADQLLRHVPVLARRQR